MFNFRTVFLALVAVASMGFAGSASANLLKRDSQTAAAPSSLMIPIPGLATLSLNLTGGLHVGLNLFPNAPGTTPLINLSLLQGKIGVVAFIGPPVPEPETYAMMGLGLGLVALAARRRRKSSELLTPATA
jgi:hypothetical protein